jgi:diguanylate cyclase (GGDEF)-like protein/PAS domain S-box-containing protein
LIVALAAASLMVFTAAGIDFQWNVDAWLLAHGVLETLIIVVSAHVVSISLGLWATQRDPRWLVLGAGFLLATLLNVGHLLFYADLVAPAPQVLSRGVFVWAHESTACLALLAAAFVMGEQRVGAARAAMAIGVLVLFAASVVFFGEALEAAVQTSWMEKGNNFFNIVLCVGALFLVGTRVAAGNRTLGLVAIGAAAGVETVAQLSYVATRQYTDSYTTLAHGYKLIAFALLYYGLFFTGFLRPYNLLHKTENLFRTLVERSPAGIVLSRGGRIIHANQAFLGMFAFPDLAAARRARLWELDAEDTREARGRHLAREAGRQEVPSSFIRRAVRYDGGLIHVRVEHEVVEMADGRATLGYFIDLSETIKAQKELQKLAHYDPLTALPNRTLLLERLEQSIRIAGRTGEVIAVLFIDLDQFKGVNDSLGHASGDELLKLVAKRLKKVCRREDTLGRLGGDEFLVIARHLESHEGAAVLAHKLIRALDEPFKLQGRELYVGGSVGVSMYPRDARDVGGMTKNADIAMYQAKRGGGPRVCFYSEDMNARAIDRLELGGELRRALEREEFELFYQPKIELATGRVSGAEALLRWKSASRGMVSPSSFVRILEDNGLIRPVGRLVLAKACHQAMEWRSAGFGRIPVAVNLSAAQFRGGQLVEDVEIAIQASGLPHEDLELELTESVLFEDLQQARDPLIRLTDKGVRAALDDFGTGYSSLSSLHNLPVQCVKVDRSFTQALETGGRNTIVSAIISVAHTLGMRVVAEGVETEAQRAILQDLGCDEIQGYLIAQPMSANDFAHWMRTHRTPHLVAISKDE